MSYGFTPYDKKSYKESKKRRKQALRAAKTGRILPYGTIRRRVVVCLCAVVLAVGMIVGGYALYAIFFRDTESAIAENPKTEESSELLLIVNRNNPLEQSYVPKLSDYISFKVNTLAYDDLSHFLDEAKSQEISLDLTSAYISYDEQQKIYNEKLNEFLADPQYTAVRAQAAVQKIVPQGGNSEAQTGLLVSFDVSSEQTEAFLERNCINYGFILRYPEDKENITLMSGSKNIYRYVGKDNALKMRSYNMCLEEYVDYLSEQKNAD